MPEFLRVHTLCTFIPGCLVKWAQACKGSCRGPLGALECFMRYTVIKERMLSTCFIACMLPKYNRPQMPLMASAVGLRWWDGSASSCVAF